MMLQGLYAAAAGMEAQQTQFDAISNDMANLDTTGYQSEQIGFQDLLYSGAGSASGSAVATGTGSAASVIGRNASQGPINPTGRSLDVALNGPGYLQVRRGDGSVGLTRDGALQMSANGELTDQDGNPLLPPVRIPSGVNPDSLHIAADGTVGAGTRTFGRISVVNVPAPNGLAPVGSTTFVATAASGATRPAAGTSLQQGALEGSNVDVAQAMSEMIDAERSYQMASQAIQYQDQMLQIADGVKK